MYQYYTYTPCRTFFNATSPIGCHTTKGGVTAPLYSITDISDLVTLKTTITAKQIIVTSSISLSNELAREINLYQPVGWIITYANKKPFRPFSAGTPNPWNPNASGLRWSALTFPIVFVANEVASQNIELKTQWNHQNKAHDDSNAEVAKLDPYVGPGKKKYFLFSIQVLNCNWKYLIF